ncbi:RNA-binding motif protein, X-linked 2-like [Oscarella lobularis]|uniref:RNA-binding motif protein, X-linked 2-like n=1 Tax=Oscarella lobularis TaxID=121494 RepID=UPI0033132A5E
MNPLTKIKAIQKLNKAEIEAGVESTAASWHSVYKDSAYVFIGGLNYELTEGDIITAFSQYGEIVSVNLVRDKSTGKSKGFCFLAYEDQRSTILAVDNLNGIKLASRIIRVDHVRDYKAPKLKDDEELKEVDCTPRTPSPEPEPELIKKKKKKKDKKTEKAKEKLGLKTRKDEKRRDVDYSSELLDKKYSSDARRHRSRSRERRRSRSRSRERRRSRSRSRDRGRRRSRSRDR